PKDAAELHPRLIGRIDEFDVGRSAAQTDAGAGPARPGIGAASGASVGDDAPIANVYIPMGLTAENVAERWDVSREEMDRFGQQSQERAVAAQDSGFFDPRSRRGTASPGTTGHAAGRHWRSWRSWSPPSS